MQQSLEALATSSPGHGLRRYWQLDPACHFLNHGSYGATPRHVLAAQDAWRQTLERQPVRFMAEELPVALRAAAARLATFVGTDSQRLAFVENATDGVNAVLRSFAWKPGDEIVLANHAYRAVRHTVDFLARRHGLLVRIAPIAFPGASGEALAGAYCSAITSRTRVAIVDHVFSPLALVTPLQSVVQHCQRLGVALLVDGAHAPGMLPLALDALGADWYVGNCHKWLCAPKGCAFLYATAMRSHSLHPTVISNYHGAGFPAEFDWQGTRDYSGWLAVTAALDFIAAFGAERYRQCLQQQALQAAHMLCERWQVSLPAAPATLAAMVTLPWPWAEEATLENAKRWHDNLLREHQIEVPVIPIGGGLWVRISAQIYNALSDYEALGAALQRH